MRTGPAPWADRIRNASRSPEDWARRSDRIRLQVLVAAGLWPEFDRPPLRSEVYGRTEHEGFSLEKVRMETWPGFELCANLYRPGAGAGRRPGILSLHGHWQDGRFTERKESSLPGRAIGLARLGFVVLSTDMAGYADTTQIPHGLSDVPWGISLLGLQLWSNIRCLDFLEGLGDVDPARIGVTGASGGATQTFLLAAVDRRVACSVPVNMVTSGCQGGCSCENAPLLRIDLNNVEIAAAIAPRPLMLVSCTGDWTAKTEKRDAPVVARAYASLGAPDRFRAATVDAGHNYNRESRELAYAWLSRWLLGTRATDRIPEAPYVPLSRKDLTVWDAEHPRPAGLRDAPGLAADLRARIASRTRSLVPRDAAALERFRELMVPAVESTVAARFGPGRVELRRDGPDPVISVVTEAESASFRGAGRVLILRPHPREAPVNPDADTGSPEWIAWREMHPLTYYRTGLARQAGDILVAVHAHGGAGVRLEASVRAAVAVLLARSMVPAGAIGATTLDLGGADARAASFWTGAMELPGILGIGGLETAAILAAPGPLELRGARRLDLRSIRAGWRAAGSLSTLSLAA